MNCDHYLEASSPKWASGVLVLLVLFIPEDSIAGRQKEGL